MKTTFARFTVCLAAVSLLCASVVAQTNLVLNGDFETVNNPNFHGGPGNVGANGDKMFFATANPDHWSNAPGSGSNYTYLCAPGTADTSPILSGPNPFPVYGPFPTSSGTGATGGNFAQQDADPTYNEPITQSITITSAGQYVLRFDEAGGQQDHPNYTSPTTDRWQVTLGAAGTQSSPGFSLPGPITFGTAADVGPWHSVSMNFNVPAAGLYLLEFVAMGSPSGQPPVSFLDNVSLVAVPEPASLAIVGIGVLGSVVLRKYRRGKV